MPAQEAYPELELYKQSLSPKKAEAYHKALEIHNKKQNTDPEPTIFKEASVQKARDLSEAFRQNFRSKSPDYNTAFIRALDLEDALEEVTEEQYPSKRTDYVRLGEAYYLFNDFEKSISVLKKAISEFPPLSFTDRANLDARKIIGICYANTNLIDTSDYYFRSILESSDLVLDRPLYNAYALSYLGCNAMIKGEYKKALALDGAVLPFFRSYTDYGHLAGMYYCRFTSYFATGDLPRAGIAADSVLYYANRDTYHPNKRRKQAFTALAKYYATIGDASLTKAYSDSLVSIYRLEERGHTSQYIANAQQVKRRLTAEQAQLKAETYRKNMIAGIIVSIVVILGLCYIVIQYRRLRIAHRILVDKSRQWAQWIGESYHRKLTENNLLSSTDEVQIMQQVQTYVIKDKNYLDTELNLDKVARQLNINRTYLSSTINNVTGKNFNAYVNEYRISEAVRMFNNPDCDSLSIDTICTQSGFNNKRSFYNYFNKIIGIPPGEYRESLNKG